MELLAEGARRLGLSLTADQLGAFRVYYETLIAWNKRTNLTRITDYRAVQVKHFLDSLSCVLAFEFAGDASVGQAGVGPKVIDVGSGAGFPGLVLKIAWPTLHLALLEATGKKAEFLRVLVERLELSNVTVIHGRAEDVGQAAAHREQYDLALARALAEMAALAELTLPLVRLGGRVVAQKGEDPTAEVQSAQKAILTLGGRLRQILPVVVPGLDAARHLVVLDKVLATPPHYPRRAGVPVKRPLGDKG